MTISQNIDLISLYEATVADKSKKFPNGFWKDHTNVVGVMKYLVEEKLKWSEHDIKKQYTGDFLKEQGLYGLITQFRNIFTIIDTVYPGRFKPWELKSSPKNFWNDETSAEAIRWMIEEKLKWSDKQVKMYLSTATFRSCGLYGLLHSRYHGNLLEAMNSVYPGRFVQGDFELEHAYLIAEDSMSPMARF